MEFCRVDSESVALQVREVYMFLVLHLWVPSSAPRCASETTLFTFLALPAHMPSVNDLEREIAIEKAPPLPTMLQVVTSALALTVGMRTMQPTARAHATMNVKSFESKQSFGSLPASVSMAGATPIVVGQGGKASYTGGAKLAEHNPQNSRETKPFGSSLPASVSMAGATPIIVGQSGKATYTGGSTLAEDPVRSSNTPF